MSVNDEWQLPTAPDGWMLVEMEAEREWVRQPGFLGWFKQREERWTWTCTFRPFKYRMNSDMSVEKVYYEYPERNQ